jgi:CCR4-NOT transcription complex subunit 1
LLTPRPTGRYLLLTAAANQLRYPNSHSAYFSYLLLYLYGEGHEGDASTKEQITRVLLERLIVNRPHPWALLLTTFELLRNRRYILPKAPAEIERLLSHMKAGLVSGATDSGAPGGPTEGGASSPGSQHMLAANFAADANAAHLQHELRNGA